MRKKQKIKSKKQSQRAYKSFITKTKWWRNGFNHLSLTSNIYGDESKNSEVTVYKLPLWRDVTNIQKLAYFVYFMTGTDEFLNLKPFSLNFSKPFRERYKKLTYKELKAVIIKKVYGNLDYKFKNADKPMMLFILENKVKSKRKDINDKETHIHGIREVFDETVDKDVQKILKTSVCNRKKEYKEATYKTMLQTKEYKKGKNAPAGWLMYLNKGTCSNNSLYISQSLLAKIRDDYNLLFDRYTQTIKHLKDKGVKIKFKEPIASIYVISGTIRKLMPS